MSREIDALIAEHVMGWKWKTRKEIEDIGYHLIPIIDKFLTPDPEFPKPSSVRGFNGYQPLPVPYYSTDIAAAWECLDKIKDYIGIDIYFDKNGWGITLHVQTDEDQNTIEVSASNSNMAMAISIALLKAHGIEVGE